MKLFTICPECGYKLGRSEEGASFNSVKESVQAARKKMQKNLKRF